MSILQIGESEKIIAGSPDVSSIDIFDLKTNQLEKQIVTFK